MIKPQSEPSKNDHVPCTCCGLPIGKSSAAAKSGNGRCFDCTAFKFVQYANKHNPDVCAQDRDATIDYWTNDRSGDIVLPSGRTLTLG